MIMAIDSIEEFGQRLVQYVRDASIKSCLLTLDPTYQGVDGKRWRSAANAAGGQVLTEMVIADCADSTIGHVLYEIDGDQLLHLLFTTQHGEIVDLLHEGGGELAGWYRGPGSWCTWYSKERIVDLEDFDISDLKAEWGTENIPDDPAPNLDELEMPRRAIEELGILLVRHVRDIAIQSCDLQLLPHSQTPTAKRWRQAAISHGGKVPPEVLIPDCVDETIFTFLRAIDQGLLPLSFVAENGEIIDLVKEGQGQLATKYSAWRDTYSKERIGKD